METHNFHWVDPLFKWQCFKSKLLVYHYQRVHLDKRMRIAWGQLKSSILILTSKDAASATVGVFVKHGQDVVIAI